MRMVINVNLNKENENAARARFEWREVTLGCPLSSSNKFYWGSMPIWLQVRRLNIGHEIELMSEPLFIVSAEIHAHASCRRADETPSADVCCRPRTSHQHMQLQLPPLRTRPTLSNVRLRIGYIGHI